MSAFPTHPWDTNAPTGGHYFGQDLGFSDTAVAAWFPLTNPRLYVIGDEESDRREENRRLTREALAWAVAHSDVPPPPELEARHGYQDAPRLPCYREVRTR